MTEKQGKILIIDDSRLNLLDLSQTLSPDYTLHIEEDVESGIKAAKAFKPDLILMDVIMPKVTGFEAIKIFKDDEDTSDIPVIFLTGLTDSEDEETGLVLGASDYITKPFRPIIVRCRVNTHVKLHTLIRKIQNLSMEDELTGLGNRRYFNNVLKQEWGRSMRNKEPLSFLIMDIDHFKNYNDTYGHISGDIVLQKIAEVIKNSTPRSTDSVARWGGEEFAAILADTDLPGALIVAERIRSNVEAFEIEIENGVKTKVTLSIGVHCVIAGNDKDYQVSNLLINADTALYEAKNQGRNRVVAFRV